MNLIPTEARNHPHLGTATLQWYTDATFTFLAATTATIESTIFTNIAFKRIRGCNLSLSIRMRDQVQDIPTPVSSTRITCMCLEGMMATTVTICTSITSRRICGRKFAAMECGPRADTELQLLCWITKCISLVATTVRVSWMTFTSSTSRQRLGPWLIFQECLFPLLVILTCYLLTETRFISSEDALVIQEVTFTSTKLMKNSGALCKPRTQTQLDVEQHHRTSLRAKWALSTKWDHLKHPRAGFATLARSWRIVSTSLEATTASRDSTISTTSFCQSKKILNCHSLPLALTSKAGSQTLKTQTSPFWLRDQKNDKCLPTSSSLVAVHTSQLCSRRLLCTTKRIKLVPASS